MKHQSFLIVVSILLIVSALLGACAQPVPLTQETTPITEETTSVAPPPPQARAPVGAPAELKIGIVTFLSGAGSLFGIPSRNAAEAMIAELNAGKAPTPYKTPGIGGVPIRPVYVDEAGGPDKQVTEFRRLVLDEKVDLVIGYVSSATCLAIAPVAEELQKLTVLYTCATHRIFEESSYKYVFRTKATELAYNVGAARYALKIKPDLRTIAGINQDYAWGHDSWEAFRDTVLQLKPGVQVVSEQFPKLFAGDYSAEITALLAARPDVIHSSFWGGDLEGAVIQGGARGLFAQSRGLFIIGEAMLPSLGEDVPAGLLIGAEGTHGALAPDNALNRWFARVYQDRYDTRPIHPAYHMALALLGVKAAYEKAIAANNGQWPTQDQVIAAFEGLDFETPSGTIRMALGAGHQAIEPVAFGITGDFDPQTGERKLTDVMNFPAECVNPPEGITGKEWIAQGFLGAKCPQ
ncbi:MAG TPA: ABC transporter substrate-binding protein [Anaerolineae bacterium]|nr:ABC transporter substrate-binding protein [Anaerolineae bacterium]